MCVCVLCAHAVHAPEVGLSAIATHYTDGRLADNVSAPYTLTLVPNEQLRADMPHTCNGPVTDYFKAIPPGVHSPPPHTLAMGSRCVSRSRPNHTGTIIFHVLGQPGPCSGLVPLGHIRITSALTTSVYADTKLFFQHQVRAASDLETWLGVTPPPPPPLRAVPQRAEDDMATRPEWRELEATCGGGVH